MRRLRPSRLRRLLKDHMSVGASHAERANPGTAWVCPSPPGREASVDEERAVRQVDIRVGALEPGRRRQLLVNQGLHGVDEAGHTRGRFQVAHVGLHGTQAQKPLACVRAEGPRQRGEFDGVAQRRRGAVRLEVAD